MQEEFALYEFEDTFGTNSDISSDVLYEISSSAPDQSTTQESELWLSPLGNKYLDSDNFYAENQATVLRNEICDMTFLGSDDGHFQKEGKWTEQMLGFQNPTDNSALSGVCEDDKIEQAAFSEKTAPIFSGLGTSLSSGIVSIEDYWKVSVNHLCYECGATFTSEYHLETHLKKHAKPKQFPVFTAISSGSEFHSNSSLDNEGNSSNSKDCAVDTGNESSRIAAERKRRKSYLSAKYREENIRNKRYKCHNCQKVFAVSSELKQHERTHTGEKPYICEICNSAFAQTTSLKRHMAIHEGVKPHECNICRKKFSRNDQLSIHFRIHKREKPYVCDICNFIFAQKSTLTRHMAIHARGKP